MFEINAMSRLPVYEQLVEQVERYVPDELYFLPGADLKRMVSLYRAVYPRFDETRFYQLASEVGLSMDCPITEFSKGMKRQAATMLALATRADFLFFDETFDGLDPVMRHYIKGIIAEDILSRGASAVIASHSLRELEDTCDQLAMLHQGASCLKVIYRTCVPATLRYRSLSAHSAANKYLYNHSIPREFGFDYIFPLGRVYLVFLAPFFVLLAFRYAMKRRDSDFYDSLPVTRTAIFFSRFAAAMTWTVIIIVAQTAVGLLSCRSIDCQAVYTYVYANGGCFVANRVV